MSFSSFGISKDSLLFLYFANTLKNKITSKSNIIQRLTIPIEIKYFDGSFATVIPHLRPSKTTQRIRLPYKTISNSKYSLVRLTLQICMTISMMVNTDIKTKQCEIFPGIISIETKESNTTH